MEPIAIASLLAVPIAAVSPGEAPELLGRGELSSGCGTSLVFAGAQIGIGIAQTEIYVADVNAATAPNLAGEAVVLTAASGEPFLQAVETLTNGIVDQVRCRTLFGTGPGGCFSGRNEPFFFTFSGLACPNGVDFAGAIIERIELRIDDVFFGPRGLGSTTVLVEAELSVYGHDPAPCVPPRLYRRLAPTVRALPAAVHAPVEGDASRWRLWIEHPVPPQASPRASGPAALEMLVVSSRALERELLAGELACDPSPDALLLARALAPGESVTLAGPSSLVAQVVTWDASGLRLSPALLLRTPTGGAPAER